MRQACKVFKMIPISDPDIKRFTFPYVTLIIIMVNVIVFAYEVTLNNPETTKLFYSWGVIPSTFTQGIEQFGSICYGEILSTSEGRICRGEVLILQAGSNSLVTLISSMFIHSGFMHFAGNMLFLWVFGDNVEDVIGHKKYLAFYLICGVLASLSQIIVDIGSSSPIIGASGAIAGVLGAYIIFFPRSRINTLVIFYFITITRIPAIYMLGIWFILQIFNGLGSFQVGITTQVAYWAHIGGFISGIIIIKILVQPYNNPADYK